MHLFFKVTNFFSIDCLIHGQRVCLLNTNNCVNGVGKNDALNVAHFVVYGDEVLVSNCSAHLNTYVVSVIERMCTRMAHHTPVGWPLKHRLFPEHCWHRSHAERLEKFIAHIKHLPYRVVLRLLRTSTNKYWC